MSANASASSATDRCSNYGLLRLAGQPLRMPAFVPDRSNRDFLIARFEEFRMNNWMVQPAPGGVG